MTQTTPMRKTDIKRAEREETTRIAQADSEKRLQEARDKTVRLREQRLARDAKSQR